MDNNFLRSKIMKRIFAAAVFGFFLCFTVATQTSSDSALKSTLALDAQDRDKNGKLLTLAADEHIKRGYLYMDNRHFPEAQEHFQKVLENYPNDPLVARALFGMGRAYMWEKRYVSAIPFFTRVSTQFPDTKDGREGLSFLGACNVRIGKNEEAAAVYERYATMYPTGERIEGAYLNIIDALREAGDYSNAIKWVENTRQRFANTPTEMNAQQARIRLEIHRQNWAGAIAAADELLKGSNFTGSMTTADEVRYLKAIALENSGDKIDAMAVYASIPDVNGSYFGGLSSDRLNLATNHVKRTAQMTTASSVDYPVVFRSEVLQYSRPNGLDPRFVMAIMKQESTFRPDIKSPAAARGLLQLVFDTASKYNEKAGIPTFTADDLYKPSVNIAIGCAYMGDLKQQFNGMYEAIAASYNGGEDNAARWLNRTKPVDPGIFTAEIGFPETKDYVFKVMTNYRIYRSLYDEDLNRR